MTWFKVDDSFHSHPKVMATDPAALGLWVIAGSWCSSNLMDGFVPDHVLSRLLPGAAKLAQKLITAELWSRTEGGYRFHDWHDFNPSSEQVTAGREAAARRQRNARDAARSRSESRRDIPVTHDPSHGPPDPTRPDPKSKSKPGGHLGMPAASKSHAREPAREPTPAAATPNGGRPAGRQLVEHPSPLELNATATRHGGYALTARWALDNPGVTTAQQRRLAKAVDDLLAAQADPTLIPAALDEAHRPHWRDPVASLPSAYDRARRDAHPAAPAPVRSAPRESASDRAAAESDAACDAVFAELGYDSRTGHYSQLRALPGA